MYTSSIKFVVPSNTFLFNLVQFHADNQRAGNQRELVTDNIKRQGRPGIIRMIYFERVGTRSMENVSTKYCIVKYIKGY